MPDNLPYADIIILALIAGFILLRLRSILGDKSGNDNPSFFNKVLPPAGKQEPIVQLDEKSLKPKLREEPDSYLVTLGTGEVPDMLNAIKVRDPQFSATHFLQGARAAFEMVFDAFTKGDKATLKMLMSEAIYQHFSTEIDARDPARKAETTLVSVSAKDITHVSLVGNVAQISVHFLSEQVSVVRGEGGAIVEGDPSHIEHVEDHWVLERDTTSKNPNWKIIET
jgi:predicted lipid-binding transport protein (Tim44 family)